MQMNLKQMQQVINYFDYIISPIVRDDLLTTITIDSVTRGKEGPELRFSCRASVVDRRSSSGVFTLEQLNLGYAKLHYSITFYPLSLRPFVANSRTLEEKHLADRLNKFFEINTNGIKRSPTLFEFVDGEILFLKESGEWESTTELKDAINKASKYRLSIGLLDELVVRKVLSVGTVEKVPEPKYYDPATNECKPTLPFPGAVSDISVQPLSIPDNLVIIAKPLRPITLDMVIVDKYLVF